MADSLLLIGGGGHCLSVIEALGDRFEQIGIIDNARQRGQTIMNIPIVGDDNELPLLKSSYNNAFVSLGSIGGWQKRANIYALISGLHYEIPNIIHNSAVLSQYLDLSKGIFIAARVIVNAASKIENMVILNTGSIIEHECFVGSYAHIGPGAILCGNVSVGKGTHIGAGSVIKQNVQIGENVLIGMGSVVTRDIPDNVVAYGNPCKIMKDR